MTPRRAIWITIGFFAAIIALNIIGRLTLLEPVLFTDINPSQEWSFYITDATKSVDTSLLKVYVKKKYLYLKVGKIKLEDDAWVSTPNFSSNWSNDYVVTIFLNTDKTNRAFQLKWRRGKSFVEI